MPTTPTTAAEARTTARIREQVAAALAYVADRQRRLGEKPPRPKPARELFARLTPRERVVVRTVAAAEVAQHTYGPTDPRTQQWNQVITENQERFEQTVRDHDRFRDAAAREAEALAGAAVAVAVGAAFWEQMQPEPADIRRDLADLDTPATQAEVAAEVADPAPAATPAEVPVQAGAMWDEVPPEVLDRLAAAMQSHPHSLPDMLNNSTETPSATPNIDPQMGAEYGMDSGYETAL